MSPHLVRSLSYQPYKEGPSTRSAKNYMRLRREFLDLFRVPCAWGRAEFITE